MNYLIFLRIVYKMKGFRTGKNLCRNGVVNFFDIVSRLGNNQARLVVSLTANDVAFVAFVAFVDLRSRLLLLGKVQTSLTLLSLNRSLAFVA